MAFQFSEGGSQYHQPVAPQLPERVNIPQGDFVGNSIVNAFVHRAIASERAQLEQKEQLQRADLEAQRLEYQDKWQTQDHDIAQQNADSLDKYRKQTAENYIANKKLRDDTRLAKLDAQEKAKNLIESTMGSIHEFDTKATPAAQPIFKQERIINDPAGIMRDAGIWMQKYGGATVGQGPIIEKQIKEIVKGLKAPVIPNAEYVNSKGGKEVEGEDVLAWRVPAGVDKETGEFTTWRAVQPSDVIQRPMQEIADEYTDPVNRARIANQLISAGHGSIYKSETTSGFDFAHPIKTRGEVGKRKKTDVYHTPILDPWADKLLSTLGRKRTTVPSEVPYGARIPLKKWQIVGGIARGEAPAGAATFSSGPGDQEATLQQQALTARDMDPSALDRIKEIYRAQTGDPDADTSFLDQ